VKLEIFDITGKNIRTLINEKMKEGMNEVKFNATGLPSGVYFYRIQTEGFSDVKKMLMIK
jgi:hypothetical protein